MTLRVFVYWLVGLVASILLSVGCATAQSPTPETRIIAIGDLHGDYDAFADLLTQAKLVDHHGNWTGGKTILIQTGDVPDRGPDSLKIIQHLKKLQRQAIRKHGRVITLIGNHEAMNMTGDLRYVHPGEYRAFTTNNSKSLRERTYKSNRTVIDAFYLAQNAALSSVAIKAKWFEDTPLGKIEHQSAWGPRGKVGKWVAQNPAVAIVGDSLFVHGGISQHYASYSIGAINGMIAEALTEQTTDPASIINDEMGPLWYRGNINPTTTVETSAKTKAESTGEAIISADMNSVSMSQLEEIDLVLRGFGVARIIITHTPSLLSPTTTGETSAKTKAESTGEPIISADMNSVSMSQLEEIDLVLRSFGVARIIVAHTPNLHGIKASFDGKLIQIDTGIADYYRGTQSFLEIRDGIPYAHDNGVVTTITTEKTEAGIQ